MNDKLLNDVKAMDAIRLLVSKGYTVNTVFNAMCYREEVRQEQDEIHSEVMGMSGLTDWEDKQVSGIFSNGSEYRMFDEIFCCNCNKYVPWEEATDDNPECSIEAAIARAQFDIDSFPHEFIQRRSGNELPYCTEWEGGE